MNKRKITIAKHAGFCFGVKRAIEMVEKALKEGKKPYCVGHLIHNNQVIEMLGGKGMITVDGIEKIPSKGLMVVRSHGTTFDLIKKAKKRKIEILDATCPFVRKAQLTAQDFHEKGYAVVICGDPDHAEVVGINSWIKNFGKVVRKPDEIGKIKFKKNIVGVLSQTTEKNELLEKTAEEILKSGVKKVIVKNTICLDSREKKKEVLFLSEKVDVMIIIGGKFSSNTKKLFELSKKVCKNSHHIETEKELKKEWFLKAKKVGIAAGASTADFAINDVVEKIKSL